MNNRFFSFFYQILVITILQLPCLELAAFNQERSGIFNRDKILEAVNAKNVEYLREILSAASKEPSLFNRSVSYLYGLLFGRPSSFAPDENEYVEKYLDCELKKIANKLFDLEKEGIEDQLQKELQKELMAEPVSNKDATFPEDLLNTNSPELIQERSETFKRDKILEAVNAKNVEYLRKILSAASKEPSLFSRSVSYLYGLLFKRSSSFAPDENEYVEKYLDCELQKIANKLSDWVKEGIEDQLQKELIAEAVSDKDATFLESLLNTNNPKLIYEVNKAVFGGASSKEPTVEQYKKLMRDSIGAIKNEIQKWRKLPQQAELNEALDELRKAVSEYDKFQRRSLESNRTFSWADAMDEDDRLREIVEEKDKHYQDLKNKKLQVKSEKVDPQDLNQRIKKAIEQNNKTQLNKWLKSPDDSTIQSVYDMAVQLNATAIAEQAKLSGAIPVEDEDNLLFLAPGLNKQKEVPAWQKEAFAQARKKYGTLQDLKLILENNLDQVKEIRKDILNKVRLKIQEVLKLQKAKTEKVADLLSVVEVASKDFSNQLLKLNKFNPLVREVFVEDFEKLIKIRTKRAFALSGLKKEKGKLFKGFGLSGNLLKRIELKVSQGAKLRQAVGSAFQEFLNKRRGDSQERMLESLRGKYNKAFQAELAEQEEIFKKKFKEQQAAEQAAQDAYKKAQIAQKNAQAGSKEALEREAESLNKAFAAKNGKKWVHAAISKINRMVELCLLDNNEDNIVKQFKKELSSHLDENIKKDSKKLNGLFTLIEKINKAMDVSSLQSRRKISGSTSRGRQTFPDIIVSIKERYKGNNAIIDAKISCLNRLEGALKTAVESFKSEVLSLEESGLKKAVEYIKSIGFLDFRISNGVKEDYQNYKKKQGLGGAHTGDDVKYHSLPRKMYRALSRAAYVTAKRGNKPRIIHLLGYWKFDPDSKQLSPAIVEGVRYDARGICYDNKIYHIGPLEIQAAKSQNFKEEYNCASVGNSTKERPKAAAFLKSKAYKASSFGAVNEDGYTFFWDKEIPSIRSMLFIVPEEKLAHFSGNRK